MASGGCARAAVVKGVEARPQRLGLRGESHKWIHAIGNIGASTARWPAWRAKSDDVRTSFLTTSPIHSQRNPREQHAH